MGKLFKVDILTQEKTLFKGEVYSLVVPAELGYLGVMADHAPIVAKLTPGQIALKSGEEMPTLIQSTGKGLLEVEKNKAVILLDSVA